LTDADYCSKQNIEVVKEIGTVPVIPDNPKKKGKSHKI
jgi:hypothetical protein